MKYQKIKVQIVADLYVLNPEDKNLDMEKVSNRIRTNINGWNLQESEIEIKDGIPVEESEASNASNRIYSDELI